MKQSRVTNIGVGLVVAIVTIGATRAVVWSHVENAEMQTAQAAATAAEGSTR